MNIFKKWYSYIDDVLIEETSSELNPLLQVYISKGRYQLCTEKAIYSFEDKYENFHYAFSNLHWPNFKIKQVLVLGLGLGSIPQMLEQQFEKSLTYTLVELDEEVIHLANKFVLNKLNSPITVIQADALRFIEQANDQFELICMDVFVDNIIPMAFREIEALEHLHRLLQSGGLLMYNVLRMGFEKETDLLIDKLETIFGNVWYDQIQNNLIIYAMKK